jgi:hypothetical protein
MTRIVRRPRAVTAKITIEEHEQLEACSLAEGKTLSEWSRETLLHYAARGQPDTTLILLAEIVALRAIVLNLFFAVANKEPLNVAEMDKLVASADASKATKAKNLLVFPAPKKRED